MQDIIQLSRWQEAAGPNGFWDGSLMSLIDWAWRSHTGQFI